MILQNYNSFWQFDKELDSLLKEENAWDDFTIGELKTLIGLHLKFIFQHPQRIPDAKNLQNKFLMSSKKINKLYQETFALNVAFEIICIGNFFNRRR